MTTKTPDRAYAWSGALFWAAAASWAKLEQARHLQNQAYDLGIYASVLWNTAHGAWFRDGVKGVNYLADHFSPGLLLLVPFARMLGVAQCVALAAAIPAVHRLGWLATKDRVAAACLAAAFAASPLLLDAARYDAHAVAFAVPLLAWALVRFKEQRPREALLLLALAGTLQEDMWLCAAAAAWWAGRRRASLAFLAAFAAALAAMRLIGGGWTPAHWDFYSFSNLGLETRARGLARLLLPLAGGPLFAGKDALPLLVPFAYTWLGDNPHQQSFNLHYGAALLPFAFLTVKRPRLALVLTLCWLPFHKRWFHPAPAGRLDAVRDIARLLPAEAPLAASFNLVPPLALRPTARLWRGEDLPGFWTALDASPAGFAPDPARDARVRDFVAARRERVVFERAGLFLLKPADALLK
ncbi:MAG: DUF2079 domain-containing protein [Elusimicrobiota bacterium]|nr:DUF2079 domain-containing protein [Elusimicrobiota bacterium]